MDVKLAAFHVVQDWPGGASALAPMLGKNPATLSHEVNPNYTTAKFGLDDAVKVTLLTGDLRIATAFAAQVGCMLLPLPGAAGSKVNHTAIAEMAREFAEMVARVSEASADGKVTPNELVAVEREAGELVAAVQNTVRHVAAMVKRRDVEVQA